MRTLTLLQLLLTIIVAAPAGATCTRPLVEAGIDAEGRPTAQWLDAIRDRVDPQDLRRIGDSKAPFTEAERGWARLVERESATICGRFITVDAAFRGVLPPRRVHILIGNQAGDDAFTAGPQTIVLDLSVFAQAYGASAGSERLLDRILAHEYSHLLLVPYMDRLGWREEWAARDPYLRAVRTLYNEGIANLRSIEDPKWVNTDGSLTPFAQSTVSALEPVMLDRLRLLEANPPPDAAAKLLRNISQGPFTGKWGALPVAIWLQEETRGAAVRLRKWVAAGPRNILVLALRNASPERRADFKRLLDAVSRHERMKREI